MRFFLALLVGLGLLTLAANVVVHRTLWLWSERDLRLRGELAIHGARRTLVAAWRRRDLDELRAALTDIARDKRIIAAAGCGSPRRFCSGAYLARVTRSAATGPSSCCESSRCTSSTIPARCYLVGHCVADA